MAALPQEYRSDTEYRFGKEQIDAIVRVTTYHPTDSCRSVIWFPPREHVDIHQSIATTFRRTSTAGLGPLDRLPLELLHDVLLRLDMRSLFFFRQTRLRSRQAVDSLKQYQVVASHGLNLFCALLRTRHATGVSLLDFYYALCTKDKTKNNKNNNKKTHQTWNRCCFKCLQEAPVNQL